MKRHAEEIETYLRGDGEKKRDIERIQREREQERREETCGRNRDKEN